MVPALPYLLVWYNSTTITRTHILTGAGPEAGSLNSFVFTYS